MKKNITLVCLCLLLIGRITYGQETKIRFFGQPDAVYSKTKTENSINNSQAANEDINFNSGAFVMFITSQINDRISVLSEVDANYQPSLNTFRIGVERIFIKYYVNDYLSMRVGRMFTPLGYWNNQYNLGLVLQPTIYRPYQIRAAHDGGLLQTRDAGFQLDGQNITGLRFFYNVLFANGIGYFANNDKRDNQIAVTARLGVEPIDGLQIIVSGQSDHIRKGFISPTGFAQPSDGNVWLANGAIAYMNPESKLEFIGEYYHFFNISDSLGRRRSVGYFAYTGYKVTNSFIPYLVWNHSFAGKKGEPDVYFAPFPVDVKNITLGARYKLNANFVVKAEYVYDLQQRKDIPIPTPFGVMMNNQTITNQRIRLQFAFAF